AVLALLKHPLLHAGMERARARAAAETVDLVALRGGTGRPDIAAVSALFEERLAARGADPRKPFWWTRLTPRRLGDARALLASVEAAVAPLAALRGGHAGLGELVRAGVAAFEALGRDDEGSLRELYRGDAGDALAAFLRSLAG